MSATEKRYDVKLTSAPGTTPTGESFAPALAQVFGIPLWQAEQIAREAPVFVKRGVTFAIAEKLQQMLASLGAEAGIFAGVPVPVPLVPVPIVAVAGSSPSGAPPAPAGPSMVPTMMGVVPARRPAEASPPPPAPPPSAPPEPVEPPAPKVPSLPPFAATPPVRPTSTPSLSPPPSTYPSGRPPAPSVPPEEEAISLALPRSDPSLEAMPVEPATVARRRGDDLVAGVIASPSRPPPALKLPSGAPPAPPPVAPSRTFTVTPGMMALGGLLVVALAWSSVVRWLNRQSDAKMLGNTPNQETACQGRRFCLTGSGLEESRRGKRTLVVAWRTGCLDPDYRGFLEGLADEHSDLEIVGVALTAPETRDPRAAGLNIGPPPDAWPPRGCDVHFDVLQPDRGYVSDWLSSPATYLCEGDGTLTAVWRGGMGPKQRDRLTAWLEGRPWEEK